MRAKCSLAKILFLIVIICTVYTATPSLAEEIKLTTIMPEQIVGAEIEIGTYTGDGNNAREIILTKEFKPDAVMVIAHAGTDSRPVVIRTSGMPTGWSKEVPCNWVDTNIKAFTNKGFIVDNNKAVNEYLIVYSYIAIKTNQ